MIRLAELIIIKLIIKLVRYFSSNHRINNEEKEKIIKLLIDNGFKKEDFIWKSTVSKFKIYALLSFKQYGYYFIFKKDKNEYDYFPSWSEKKIKNVNILEQEFISWLFSIQRVINRSKEINTSISDGANLRKQFPNFASIIEKNEN